MDEIAKAARRAQINSELIPLRNGGDSNVSTRKRLIEQLDRLRPARNKLNACISDALTVARNVERCHHKIPDSNFKGRRRQHLVSRLVDAGGNIRAQRERHKRNLERLDNQINSVRDRRDGLAITIQNQNSRITTLEAELRSLL